VNRPAETLCWFGKVPSRGDFVRSARQAALTQLLDQWLSQGLAQLSADPRWKQLYDRAEGARFAVLGVRSRRALAGYLAPSMDASGRRFPFVALAAFQTGAPQPFLGHAPLALEPAWLELESFVQRACGADDVTPVLAEVPRLALDTEDAAEGWAQAWSGFAAGWSLGALQALLQRGHPGFELRRTLLGLGLLLQPVRRSGVARLDKGLRLPLPSRHAAAVAALWMQLLAPFLAHGDFELVLLLPRAPRDGAASLVLGFAGASPATLQALFDPQRAADAFIELQAPAWVDAQLAHDAALRKLDAYLRQDGLSLRQAVASFKDCFLGE
jgi:type VI secretion system protein ImpM